MIYYIVVVVRDEKFDCLLSGLYASYKDAQARIKKEKKVDKKNNWNYEYKIAVFELEVK